MVKNYVMSVSLANYNPEKMGFFSTINDKKENSLNIALLICILIYISFCDKNKVYQSCSRTDSWCWPAETHKIHNNSWKFSFNILLIFSCIISFFNIFIGLCNYIFNWYHIFSIIDNFVSRRQVWNICVSVSTHI